MFCLFKWPVTWSLVFSESSRRCWLIYLASWLGLWWSVLNQTSTLCLYLKSQVNSYKFLMCMYVECLQKYIRKYCHVCRNKCMIIVQNVMTKYGFMASGCTHCLASHDQFSRCKRNMGASCVVPMHNCYSQ